MSNPNRRGAMALVSASLCLTLAALFYFTAPAPALTCLLYTSDAADE